MNEQRQPCPFCGSLSIFYNEWYAMRCYSCGVQGPDADHASREAALARWNTRPGAQPTENGGAHG